MLLQRIGAECLLIGSSPIASTMNNRTSEEQEYTVKI